MGKTLARITSSCREYRIARGEPLQHGPVGKAMEYTEQMVVTVRPRPPCDCRNAQSGCCQWKFHPPGGVFAGYGSKSRRAAASGRYLRFSARLYSANRRIGTFRRAAMATFVNGWGVDTDFDVAAVAPGSVVTSGLRT